MVATIDSIRLECSCGKRARVPARYAGRRVRCSRCKTQLRVPGSGSSPDGLKREPEAEARFERKRERNEARPRNKARVADPYAPPRAKVDSPTRLEHGSTNREIDAERHIRGIAVWYRILGVLLGVGAFFFVVGGGARAIPIAAFVGAFAALYYVVGNGLFNYRGWARVIVGLLTCLGLLFCAAGVVAAPSGSVLISNLLNVAINLATLWALFSAAPSRVFGAGYRMDTRSVAWWTSPFFWGPFAMLGLAFVMGAMSAM